jgi:hypothetical protein
MTERLIDRKLYHMTTTKPYKQAFAANQVVRVCDQYNAFSGIYEKARIEPQYSAGRPLKVYIQIHCAVACFDFCPYRKPKEADATVRIGQ